MTTPVAVQGNTEISAPLTQRQLDMLVEKRAEQLSRSPGLHRIEPVPSRRIEGWPLVALILGSLFCVLSMVHWIVKSMLDISERSAARAHQLAQQAIENAPATVVDSGEAGLWVYILCLFAGTAIILVITKSKLSL